MASELENEVLDLETLEDQLADLDGWEYDGRFIHKTYHHPGFAAAMEFVNKVAEIAERINHHPDIIINYKNVQLRCWTHKKNAVTKADIALATEVEQLIG